jgi:YhcH/YjgK/YiaL family protein
MIIDTIENLKLYKGLSENLAKAINYLITNDLSSLEIGKHAIVEDDIFVLMSEYNTKEEVDCKTETHKKYIDIQIMLKGEEKFGFAFLNNQKVSETYNPEKDCMFYDTLLDYQNLHEGTFVIFFPSDLHCPSIKINDSIKVKKAVVKVKVG